MDKRYLRTERLLIEAMLALIREKPFSEISVGEIAARAGVARKTVYAHVANKQELLWLSLAQHFGEITQESDGLNPNSLLMNQKPLSYPVFQHVWEYALFYRSMLGPEGEAGFVFQLLDYLAQQSYAKHQPLREVAPFMSVPAPLIAHLLAGGLLGTIRWWLENGMEGTPEEMAYRFSQIVAPGVLQSMGLDG